METKPKIVIDVKDLLAKETGSSKTEEINYKPKESDLDEDIDIVKPIVGNVKLINTGNRILAKVNLKTCLRLECSRCLKKFFYSPNLIYPQEYSFQDNTNGFLITPDRKIDLWPSVRQELLLSVPVKPLCSEKCKGIKY